MNRITFTHSFKQFKYKQIGIISSVFLSLLLVVLGCKKIEQPDMSTVTDPCDCAKEVSADFDILEPLDFGLEMRLVKTDNVISGKSIIFKATENDAEYKWYVGADVENDQEIDRYFIPSLEGSTIPITLVVKKKPNYICFPNDDGYDSITKYMKVVSRSDSSVMEGTYRIASINSTDSIDIKINFRGHYQNNIYLPDSGSGLDIYNFDGNNNFIENYNNYVIIRAYRAFKTFTATGFVDDYFSLYITHAELDLQNKFYIKFRYSPNSDFGLIYKEMRGRKL